VISKYVWRVALVGALCLIPSSNAGADTLQQAADKTLVAIVAAVAAVVVVTVVVIHESAKKRTITGCVNSVENGMSVTDEKDKRVYTLSGDMAGIKPGERMTLQGKKIKANAGKPLVWDTRKITKDFGVCRP